MARLISCMIVGRTRFLRSYEFALRNENFRPAARRKYVNGYLPDEYAELGITCRIGTGMLMTLRKCWRRTGFWLGADRYRSYLTLGFRAWRGRVRNGRVPSHKTLGHPKCGKRHARTVLDQGPLVRRTDRDESGAKNALLATARLQLWMVQQIESVIVRATYVFRTILEFALFIRSEPVCLSVPHAIRWRLHLLVC